MPHRQTSLCRASLCRGPGQDPLRGARAPVLAAPHPSAQPPSGLQDLKRSLRDSLRTQLSPHGAQVELLADGSLVATLAPSHGSATDTACATGSCTQVLKA